MNFVKSILRWTARLLATLVLGLAVFLIQGWFRYADTPAPGLEEGPGELVWLDVAGAQVAIRRQGADQPGTPVIMIHSMFYHMGLWDAWAEELAKSRPVYRFDVPGHGLSGLNPAGDYSLNATIAVLEDIMDHYRFPLADIVGSSMGGATALNFAAANPDRVRKLVLVNSGGLEGHDKEGSGGVPDGAWWVLRYLPDMALTYFVDWTAAGNDTGDAFRQNFADAFRAPDVRRGIIGRMQDFKSPNTVTALGQVTAPTLVMWGAENPQLPVRQAHAFHDHLAVSPCKTLKIYEDAGHIMPAEGQIQPVMDLVAFLDSECAP